MVYSFDVFDTCIVRTWARPTDLFYYLAETLLQKTGQPYGREEVGELAALRVFAERQAHRKTTKQEITLENIYAELDLSGWGFSKGEMRAEEVRLELEAMRPVVPVRSRTETLRAAGERVVFISDMYLPQPVVREMLGRCGYEVPEGTLYVSSELDLTKRAGGLFKHVLEREGIKARDLRHCGDGVESDFLGARRAGVRAELLTLTQPNRFEKAVLRLPSETPWVTSQLAGTSRATRLSVSKDELRGSAEIASSVVAPLLVGFVLWALQDAKARGLKRLYFVARDGQVLHKIARALDPDGSRFGLEARYLYGSRQAWYIPSAFSVERDELEFVLMTGQSSAPRHNLKRVNLTPEALERPLARYGFPESTWETQLEGEAVERFWRFVEDPEVAPQIMAQAAAARRDALAYFGQEGLLQDDRWALVDVGWTLRTQGSLHKVLASAGQPHTLGYYLGVSKTRFSSRAYGQGRAYLLEEAENEALAPVRTLFENKGLIDQVFTMADHGSTSRYECRDGEMIPVLSELPAHPKREAFLRTVHELVVRYAAELAESPARDAEPELRACARLVTGMLIAEPTREEAAALAWAPISDDPNELRAAPLARALGAGDLFGIARDVSGRVRRLRSATRAPAATPDNRTVPTLFYKDLSWGFSWLEGSVALSGPLAKLALRGFRTLQYVNREKKALAAKPVARWQAFRRQRLGARRD